MAARMEVQTAGYYGNVRSDLVDRLPQPLGRVLDIGCGEAASAGALRTAGATSITGIEVVRAAAESARGRIDDLFIGTVEDQLPLVEGPFDTIVVWDVLEHLVDPYDVVRALHGLAAPGGRLQVSVPNARHLSLVVDLLVHGTFGYGEWGHRDRTHLRWFTRRDLASMITDAGWRMLEESQPRLGRSAPLARLTGGRSTEFLVGQLYALAVRPASAG